jgi:hypothetical protein
MNGCSFSAGSIPEVKACQGLLQNAGILYLLLQKCLEVEFMFGQADWL